MRPHRISMMIASSIEWSLFPTSWFYSCPSLLNPFYELKAWKDLASAFLSLPNLRLYPYPLPPLTHTGLGSTTHTHTHRSWFKVLTGSFSSLRSYSSKRLSLTCPKVAPAGYSILSSSHITSCEDKYYSLHSNLLSQIGLPCLFVVCKYIQNGGPSPFPPWLPPWFKPHLLSPGWRQWPSNLSPCFHPCLPAARVILWKCKWDPETLPLRNPPVPPRFPQSKRHRLYGSLAKRRVTSVFILSWTKEKTNCSLVVVQLTTRIFPSVSANLSLSDSSLLQKVSQSVTATRQ